MRAGTGGLERAGGKGGRKGRAERAGGKGGQRRKGLCKRGAGKTLISNYKGWCTTELALSFFVTITLNIKRAPNHFLSPFRNCMLFD